MRKNLLVLILLFSACISRAQSDSAYVDLGVNVIRIVNLGLGAQNLNYDVWNPYMLTANAHYKRLGLRLGVGFRNNTRTELPVDANGMSTTETDTSRMDFRVGLGWEVALAQKWTFKFGFDYYSASAHNKFTTKYQNEADETVETYRNVEMKESGIAPFAAIQYHITPRVSLGTELLWRFGSFTSEDGEISTTKPENGDAITVDITRKYEGVKRGIMAPTALFLIFRF